MSRTRVHNFSISLDGFGSSTTCISWWSRSCSAEAYASGTALEGIEKHYRIEATASPSGVTHVTFTRAGA